VTTDCRRAVSEIRKKANTSNIFEFAVTLLRLKYGFDCVGATNLIPIFLLGAG